MSIILDVANTPTFDNRITKIELHTYNPYANTSFDNSDEIRIPIQQQDLYTLPCESFLYIESRGTLTAQNVTGPATSTTAVLDNNCVAFMFDEIRYELNGVEIDRCRNPGITTTLKNYVSLSADRSKVLANAGWNYAIDYDNDIFHSGAFNFCVPLNALLGFCELILIRSRVDTNVMHCTSATAWPKLEIRKVQWRMPHVVLEEVNKLSMLRILESGRPIAMSFRSWSLHEYPLLQARTKHTWTVKATVTSYCRWDDDLAPHHAPNREDAYRALPTVLPPTTRPRVPRIGARWVDNECPSRCRNPRTGTYKPGA